MKTVRDFDFSGKQVLLRADTDEPVEDGELVDDFRLRKALPTIRHVAKRCDTLIIAGHMGRPDGVEEKYSLRPVADYLSRQLERNVPLVTDFSIPEDSLVLLENLRFHAGERENSDAFADRLANLADIYVNEAFAVSHRKHASTHGVATRLPGCIGFQFERELQHLDLDLMEAPVKAVLGGAKLDTKMPVAQHLLSRVDEVLLGGAMIFTFYQAKGWEVGTSLVDEDFLVSAKSLLGNERRILPSAVDVADSPSGEGTVVSADAIPADKQGLDVGPDTLTTFKEKLGEAATVIWNGPLGYEEVDAFLQGTEELAEFLADLDVDVVVGGGDTAAVIDELGLEDSYTHVSTGGGAALTLLEGEKLPAVQALK